MWGEREGSPVFAAPGSNNYSGLIASSTNIAIRENAGKFQGLSDKEANDLCDKYKLLAYKIARQYRGKGIKLNELKAASLLGLVEASRNFDPNRGVPFGGYSHHRIRGAIKDLFLPGKFAPDVKRSDSLDADRDDEEETFADKLAGESPSRQSRFKRSP
jgi:DNA-directed RNA polymerase specialized sigma subunit